QYWRRLLADSGQANAFPLVWPEIEPALHQALQGPFVTIGEFSARVRARLRGEISAVSARDMISAPLQDHVLAFIREASSIRDPDAMQKLVNAYEIAVYQGMINRQFNLNMVNWARAWINQECLNAKGFLLETERESRRLFTLLKIDRRESRPTPEGPVEVFYVSTLDKKPRKLDLATPGWTSTYMNHVVVFSEYNAYLDEGEDYQYLRGEKELTVDPEYVRTPAGQTHQRAIQLMKQYGEKDLLHKDKTRRVAALDENAVAHEVEHEVLRRIMVRHVRLMPDDMQEHLAGLQTCVRGRPLLALAFQLGTLYVGAGESKRIAGEILGLILGLRVGDYAALLAAAEKHRTKPERYWRRKTESAYRQALRAWEKNRTTTLQLVQIKPEAEEKKEALQKALLQTAAAEQKDLAGPTTGGSTAKRAVAVTSERERQPVVSSERIARLKSTPAFQRLYQVLGFAGFGATLAREYPLAGHDLRAAELAGIMARRINADPELAAFLALVQDYAALPFGQYAWAGEWGKRLKLAGYNEKVMIVQKLKAAGFTLDPALEADILNFSEAGADKLSPAGQTALAAAMAMEVVQAVLFGLQRNAFSQDDWPDTLPGREVFAGLRTEDIPKNSEAFHALAVTAGQELLLEPGMTAARLLEKSLRLKKAWQEQILEKRFALTRAPEIIRNVEKILLPVFIAYVNEFYLHETEDAQLAAMFAVERMLRYQDNEMSFISWRVARKDTPLKPVKLDAQMRGRLAGLILDNRVKEHASALLAENRPLTAPLMGCAAVVVAGQGMAHITFSHYSEGEWGDIQALSESMKNIAPVLHQGDILLVSSTGPTSRKTVGHLENYLRGVVGGEFKNIYLVRNQEWISHEASREMIATLVVMEPDGKINLLFVSSGRMKWYYGRAEYQGGGKWYFYGPEDQEYIRALTAKYPETKDRGQAKKSGSDEKQPFSARDSWQTALVLLLPLVGFLALGTLSLLFGGDAASWGRLLSSPGILFAAFGSLAGASVFSFLALDAAGRLDGLWAWLVRRGRYRAGPENLIEDFIEAAPAAGDAEEPAYTVGAAIYANKPFMYLRPQGLQKIYALHEKIHVLLNAGGIAARQEMIAYGVQASPFILMQWLGLAAALTAATGINLVLPAALAVFIIMAQILNWRRLQFQPPLQYAWLVTAAGERKRQGLRTQPVLLMGKIAGKDKSIAPSQATGSLGRQRSPRPRDRAKAAAAVSRPTGDKTAAQRVVPQTTTGDQAALKKPFQHLEAWAVTEKLKTLDMQAARRLFHYLDETARSQGLTSMSILERFLYVSLFCHANRELALEFARATLFLSDEGKARLQSLLLRSTTSPAQARLTFSEAGRVVYYETIDQDAVPVFSSAEPLADMPRILLTTPYKAGEEKVGQFAVPTLGVHRIASFLKAFGYEVEVYDLDLYGEKGYFERVRSGKYQMVGFSVLEPTLKNQTRVMLETEKINPDLFIFAGGQGAVFNAKFIVENTPARAVTRGVGEFSVLDMAVAFKGSQIPRAALQQVKAIHYQDSQGQDRETSLLAAGLSKEDLRLISMLWDPAEAPYRDYWASNEKRYSEADMLVMNTGRHTKTARIYTTSNCPMGCDFCSSTNMYDDAVESGNQKLRLLEARDIIRLIKRLKKTYPELQAVYFNDDDFFASENRVRQVCQALVSEGLNQELTFFALSRTDRVHPDLLRLIRSAGFYMLIYGVESFAGKILHDMEKKLRLRAGKTAVEINRQAILDSLQAGIIPKINLILFYPTTGLDDLKQTIEETMSLMRQGAVVDAYTYVNPFAGAKILAKGHAVESEPAEFETRKGKRTFSFPVRVLPADPLIRDLAAQAVRNKTEIIRQIRAAYQWQGKELLQPVDVLATFQSIYQAAQRYDPSGRFDTQQIENNIHELMKRAGYAMTEEKAMAEYYAILDLLPAPVGSMITSIQDAYHAIMARESFENKMQGDPILITQTRFHMLLSRIRDFNVNQRLFYSLFSHPQADFEYLFWAFSEQGDPAIFRNIYIRRSLLQWLGAGVSEEVMAVLLRHSSLFKTFLQELNEEEFAQVAPVVAKGLTRCFYFTRGINFNEFSWIYAQKAPPWLSVLLPALYHAAAEYNRQ
ncbi:cobalamin-dependent protein, partial [candidate division FCPU426 bacterium]|nr:cobalamin-dependent protein [candidate division FCPU426 bacterium]